MTSEHATELLLIVPAVLYAITQIVAWTPTKRDDGIWAALQPIVKILAGNYRQARNATEVDKEILREVKEMSGDKPLTSNSRTGS